MMPAGAVAAAAAKGDPTSWSMDQVLEWLHDAGLEEYAAAFRENDVDGQAIFSLTDELLDDMGIPDAAARTRILDQLAQLRTRPAPSSGGTLPRPRVNTRPLVTADASEQLRPSIAVDTGLTQMSGNLLKQGGLSNNKGWRKRYVVLENNALRYFRSQRELAGIIYVEDISSVNRTSFPSGPASCFELHTSFGRTYLFAADDAGTCDLWVSAIEAAVEKRQTDARLVFTTASYQALSADEVTVQFGQAVEVLPQRAVEAELEDDEAAVDVRDSDTWARVRIPDTRKAGWIPIACLPPPAGSASPTTAPAPQPRDKPSTPTKSTRARLWSPLKKNKAPASPAPTAWADGTMVPLSSALYVSRPANMVFSSWLMKQGDTVKTWKRRWFVLTKEFCAFYYKTPEDMEPLGKFMLPSYTVSSVPDQSRGYPNCFTVSHSGMRTYVMAADTPHLMNKWIHYLKLAAQCSLPEEFTHKEERMRNSFQSTTVLARAICVRQYIPNAYDTDALPLEADDHVEVLERDTSGWWLGRRVRDGKVGFFPFRYVALEGSDSRPNSIAETSADAAVAAVSMTADDTAATRAATKRHSAAAARLSRELLPVAKPAEAAQSLNEPSAPTRVTEPIEPISIEPIEPIQPSEPSEPGERAEALPSAAAAQTEEVQGPHYRARFTCLASAEDELSFRKGDVVAVVQTSGLEEGWWLASANGQTGLVPKDYLELVA